MVFEVEDCYCFVYRSDTAVELVILQIPLVPGPTPLSYRNQSLLTPNRSDNSILILQNLHRKSVIRMKSNMTL